MGPLGDLIMFHDDSPTYMNEKLYIFCVVSLFSVKFCVYLCLKNTLVYFTAYRQLATNMKNFMSSIFFTTLTIKLNFQCGKACRAGHRR
jgi:hypothetical protein